MLILMDIATLGMDPATNSPLVILKEHGGDRTLAIPLTPLEAGSIAMKSMDVISERPLTIDLVKIIMGQCGGSLKRVVIHDYREGLFSARIEVHAGTTVCIVECRPSDAIALAMRCGQKVFIDEAVFCRSGAEPEISEQENLRKTISGMDTVDFGKYYVE